MLSHFPALCVCPRVCSKKPIFPRPGGSSATTTHSLTSSRRPRMASARRSADPCAHLHGRPSCSMRTTRHSPLHLRGERSSSASTKGRRCLRRAGRSCNRSCLGWRVQVSLCSTNIKKLGMEVAHANSSSTTTSPAAAASSSATRTSASIVVHQLPHGITSFPSQRADAPCGTTSSLVASRARKSDRLLAETSMRLKRKPVAFQEPPQGVRMSRRLSHQVGNPNRNDHCSGASTQRV